MNRIGKFVLPALFLLLLPVSFARAGPKEFVVIDTTAAATIRAAPLGEKALGRIPAGTKVQILEKTEARSGIVSQTWYRVKFEGREGWISQYTTIGQILTEDREAGTASTARAANAEKPKVVDASTLNKGFKRASSNLWTGVQLYFGPSKMYVGDVLGGNANYRNPATGRTFRGLKVRMKSGSLEWKDRNAIILGEWYVKESDPALALARWVVYEQ
jgi:hypothetical protein